MLRDDMELAAEYARSGSEQAFAMLVSRHINLVYSVALRQVGSPDLAADITQAAFIVLARKAKSLHPNTIISAWLCRTAQYAAADARKSQRRRERREHEMSMDALINRTGSESAVWNEITPLLDTAMGHLGEKDHSAIVLRFFEGKDLKEVGAALGVSPNAAKTRVSRALEKLRRFFAGRGITVSAAALAGAVSAHSVQAAPIGLAAAVTTAALKGTTVTVSTLTLIKTTLKIMAYTKIKTIAGGSIIALLLAGTAGFVLHVVHAQAAGSKAISGSPPIIFAGFDTPEAALKSFVWSESTGDLEKLLVACTPEQAERFKKKIVGVSQDEIKQRMVQEAKNRANYEVTDKEVVSDTEVRLHLRVQPYPGHPNVGNDIQVMQKIGNDWRYAGKYGVDIKEN
jgi:RNA polymerase sigma factor (sigma-70 family)